MVSKGCCTTTTSGWKQFRHGLFFHLLTYYYHLVGNLANHFIGVLKDLRKMAPPHQITMLKFIKNLSSLSSTHEALQNSNAIDILIELLKSTRQKDTVTSNRTRSTSDIARLPPFHREISNQILNTMYNLCRHNKSRQEEAALSDVIPLLKEVVREGGPLKEFALPVLLEMVNSGKVSRKMLWDAKGLAFYVSLLGDRNWAVTALDAIFVWYVSSNNPLPASQIRRY